MSSSGRMDKKLWSVCVPLCMRVLRHMSDIWYMHICYVHAYACILYVQIMNIIPPQERMHLATCNHMDELWGHSLKWKRVEGRKRKREGKREKRKEGKKEDRKQARRQRREGPTAVEGVVPAGLSRRNAAFGAPWESAMLRGFRNWPGCVAAGQ